MTISEDILDGSHKFPTTHWSKVLAATESESAKGLVALDELIRLYRPALMAYLVHELRLREEDADDVLQEFCAEKILKKGLFSKAHPQQGKLRNLLKTALRNYWANLTRNKNAQKRAPKGGFVSMDEIEGHEPATGPTHDPTPSDLVWARTVMEETCLRMKQKCATDGRMDIWETFEGRTLRPALDGAPEVDYAALVHQLGLSSPGEASNLLITAKRMFRRILREVIAKTARDEHEIEEEIRTIWDIFSRARA